MKTDTATVAIREDADALGIAYFVQKACNFKSKIRLTDGQKSMNAKSIMGMMALGLADGDVITIEAEGPDEEEAVRVIKDSLEGK